MEVKVTRNYQITIPKQIREKVGIEEGMILEIYVDDEGKIIIKKKDEKRKTFKIGKKLTIEDIEKGIERGLKKCLS